MNSVYFNKPTRINILITSVGKRVTLVRKFKEVLTKYFPSGKVFTTDMNPKFSPAGIVSDNCFIVPRVTDSSYITRLLEIAVNNNIRIIIPTIDTELLTLAQNKMMFQEHGIEILISDVSFIEVCRDKRLSVGFFNNYHIKVPRLIDINNPTFPIFAKPYDGSLSKDLYVIQSLEDITPTIRNNSKLIFMEYIPKSDYKEFTVDLYYGKDHRVKSIVPRERLVIRAGEINKGITRKNYLVEFLKERISYLPGVVGCICIQFFYNEVNKDIIGIEINPRFGGGYPLSFYAGANYPDFIIKEYLQEESVDYSDKWLNNTLMLRYDDDIIVYEK